MIRCVAFLFLTLLVSSFWIGISIPIKIASHQKGIRQHLQKKQNVSIRISQTEWTQSVFVKADEIILNGRLFDIKHVQQDAFGVLLYGHYDTKETRLVSLQNKHRGSDQSPGASQTELTTVLFYEELPVFHFFKALESLIHSSFYAVNCIYPISTTVSPPPEHCFV